MPLNIFGAFLLAMRRRGISKIVLEISGPLEIIKHFLLGHLKRFQEPLAFQK